MKLSDLYPLPTLLALLVLSLLPSESVSAQGTKASPIDRTSFPAFILFQTQQASAERDSNSITGYVVDQSGRPLPNARVTLVSVSSQGTGSRLAGSDEEGRFRVDDLEGSAYTIWVWAPGYVEERLATALGNERRYYRPGDSVTLRMLKGGVITGTVRDANGEAVAGIPVRAIRVRDVEGQLLQPPGTGRVSTTDDRGIYRLYGLLPGSYIVAAGETGNHSIMPSAYNGKASTYYPSATRDPAAEITVRSGEERGNIDIKYRGEPGRIVSGIVAGDVGAAAESGMLWVTLAHAASGAVESSTIINAFDKLGFSFNGIADGEYEIIALRRGGTNESGATSPATHIKVQGADVTGVKLTLSPLGSIAGLISREASPEASAHNDCAEGSPRAPEETIILLKRDDETNRRLALANLSPSISAGTPNNRGEFNFRSLEAGTYYLDVRLPSENWYVSSVETSQTTARGKPPARADGYLVTLKSGEHLSGLTIRVKEDGASLRGRVVTDGEPLPERLRAHLIPVETEHAGNPLRYGETEVESDGSFSLGNIAPGRYWLIARPRPVKDGKVLKAIASDTEGRARLRSEAAKSKATIDLTSCQVVNDYQIRVK